MTAPTVLLTGTQGTATEGAGDQPEAGMHGMGRGRPAMTGMQGMGGMGNGGQAVAGPKGTQGATGSGSAMDDNGVDVIYAAFLLNGKTSEIA